MGFLSVNRPVPIKKLVKRKRLNKSKSNRRVQNAILRAPSPFAGLRSLENLPPEVTREIFVCSGNLQLPFVSKTLYRKLPAHLRYLRCELLDHKVELKGGKRSLPTSICLYRFVSSEILSDLDIEQFYDPVTTSPDDEPTPIPEYLTSEPITDRKLDLIAYLKSRNCVTSSEEEDAKILSAAVARNDTDRVRILIDVGIRLHYSSFMLAVKKNNSSIIEMILASGSLNLNDPRLWHDVYRTKDSAMLSFLTGLGITPAIQLL